LYRRSPNSMMPKRSMKSNGIIMANSTREPPRSFFNFMKSAAAYFIKCPFDPEIQNPNFEIRNKHEIPKGKDEKRNPCFDHQILFRISYYAAPN
jgi:hypothetical protein